MDNEARLAHHLGLSYDIHVRQIGGRHIFFIRELGIRHENADLAQGYRECIEKKDAWLRDLAEEGLWDWMVEPGALGGASALAPPKSVLSDLKPFLIKLTLVGVLLFALVTVVSKSLRETGYNLEKKLDAITRMEPESVEMHRAKAHAIAGKLRPIAQEILSIFRAEAESAPAPAATVSPAESPASTPALTTTPAPTTAPVAKQ